MDKAATNRLNLLAMGDLTPEGQKRLADDLEAVLTSQTLADHMAKAFEPIVCNLDPKDSGCVLEGFSNPCAACDLVTAQKARAAYVKHRGVS